MAWKNLLQLGEYGTTVRVVEESGGTRGKRVLVVWYALPYIGATKKVRRTQTFDATPDGRAEAKATAGGVYDGLRELKKGAVKPVRVTYTLDTLFQEYARRKFPLIRPKTRLGYASAWKKWQLMWGENFLADTTTMLMMDEFVGRELDRGLSANATRIVSEKIRGVYRWCKTRQLIAENPMEDYEWQSPKDALRYEPGEYSAEELERLLATLNPAFGRDWRAHSVLMLVGHQGVRMNTALHLRWEHIDLVSGVIRWPAEYIKKGEDFTQPLTIGGYAAILTARHEADRVGYTGPWVFFGSRRARWGTTKDAPYTYGAAWLRLSQAERDAGIEHEKYRAFHGLRRGVVGNVYDNTGDIRAALEMIGDSDLKQMQSYLKKRESRISKAADSIDASMSKPSPEPSPAQRRVVVDSKRVGKAKLHKDLQR